MNGKVAKRLRKAAYPSESSMRTRTYKKTRKGFLQKENKPHTLISDTRRQFYQRLKEQHKSRRK